MTDETTPVIDTPVEVAPETVTPVSDNTTPKESSDPVAQPDITLPQFKFGFVVLVDVDGGVFIEKNPNLLSIPVERESTLIEVRRYTSEILMDLQAQAAAEYTSLRIAQPPIQP